MTWRTVLVPADDLALELVAIRWAGGTVVSSRPCAEGFRVTYVSDT
ncbi:hypothetical protein [Nocardioides pocheonensis]|nr:hypothetical protein [Nocardioides pocheonensis]